MEAANRIVQREGVARLTIEAVAREASLSKGGVLYHFPSKDALIEGMITFHLEVFADDLQQALEQEGRGAGRWLRAYIRASVNTPLEESDAMTGLMAAAATNLRLLDTLRSSFVEYQEQAERDGLPPALATILRLAVDGLWLADLFGLATPQGQLREDVVRTLLELASPQSEERGERS